MPPKRKKLGRPLGSKNKKTIKNAVNEINKEESYTCDACGKSFDTDLLGLHRHEKVCIKNLKVQQLSDSDEDLVVELESRKAGYSCKECNKKFKFEKSFTKHKLLEHSKLPNSVACDLCHVRCPNKTTLKNHINNIHERKTFECKNCTKTFVRHAHVLRHMAQKGCDGKEVPEFPCEICHFKFTRKDNLMVHLRLQHMKNNHYKCKECTFHTRNFNVLIYHAQKYHTGALKHFQCDQCGKITSSRAAMVKHLEIHGDKKYACEKCGYSTYTIEVMRRHVLTHVDEKPFKCSLCGHSYIQLAQLRRHLEKHTGFMCAKCGETFKSRVSLLVHERRHMGLEKLFCPVKSCTYALKEFSNEATLQNHLKIHIDDKPFTCEVCSKKFHNELVMRRHVETHALERPRRCMYCVRARGYARGEQLLRHVRRHHAAVFRDRLAHVRQVLGTNMSVERVKKSELESILNMLDAEADRILQGFGPGVLYGGMQELPSVDVAPLKNDDSPLMNEEELAESLKKLLAKLIDKEMLECFGWPDESVDVVLEKVIEQCGAHAADREQWSRIQCLRENTKHLFLYVIEDKNIARMLHTHTIDQIIKHILAQVTDADAAES